MGECPRRADGRRVFTPEFKRTVVQPIHADGFYRDSRQPSESRHLAVQTPHLTPRFPGAEAGANSVAREVERGTIPGTPDGDSGATVLRLRMPA